MVAAFCCGAMAQLVRFHPKIWKSSRKKRQRLDSVKSEKQQRKQYSNCEYFETDIAIGIRAGEDSWLEKKGPPHTRMPLSRSVNAGARPVKTI